MTKDISTLEEQLHYTFQSKERIHHALTHRSASGKEKGRDYERLEFLGDAVLDLVVADLLLEAYPDSKEGELSKMRAAVVNTDSLVKIANTLSLSEYVQVSKAERAQGGNERPSILADLTESLIGAIYRDGGYSEAFRVVSILFKEAVATVDPRDPKTELQEVLHALNGDTPEYLLEEVEGPEHEPSFVSVVKIRGEVVGRGVGKTKKASQQEAAKIALESMSNEEVAK